MEENIFRKEKLLKFFFFFLPERKNRRTTQGNMEHERNGKKQKDFNSGAV